MLIPPWHKSDHSNPCPNNSAFGLLQHALFGKALENDLEAIAGTKYVLEPASLNTFHLCIYIITSYQYMLKYNSSCWLLSLRFETQKQYLKDYILPIYSHQQKFCSMYHHREKCNWWKQKTGPSLWPRTLSLEVPNGPNTGYIQMSSEEAHFSTGLQ